MRIRMPAKSQSHRIELGTIFRTAVCFSIENRTDMPLNNLASPGPVDRSDRHTTGSLRGNMGTASLVMTMIAYNGPIVVLAGLLPLIVGLGNGEGAPVTFLVLGLFMGMFAVGLNAMASRMTHAGAFYTYVTAGLGRPPGLAAGGVAILAYLGLSAGVLALFGISISELLESTFGLENGPPWQVWALLGWLGVSGLSLFNIGLSAKVLGTFSCIEIAIALVWNAGIYIDGGPEGRSVGILSSFLDDKLPYALVLGIVCLTGFESLQVFRAETKDPDRTVPRATYVSVALLTVMYAASSYAFVVAYGPSQAAVVGASDQGAFLASVSAYVAKPIADIANIMLATSSFAAALAVQSILSRYLYSLGKDGILPSALGKANRKHGSPMTAAGVAAGACLALIAVPALGVIPVDTAYATLTGIGGFCLVLLYFATSTAIVAFFLRQRDSIEGRLKTIVAPAVACVGVGGIVFLSVEHIEDVIVATRAFAYVVFAGVSGIVLIGVGTALWFRRNRPGTYERIGRQSENDVPSTDGDQTEPGLNRDSSTWIRRHR